ncbi:Protein-glutamate methylesterase/protein-glutamine glutaminase [Trichinella spiralis]|uniref:Protein-glutamate methylesterase/protein-glutamine glutaminase n=1 Tax=Trichinella spiralis TaxID=6334 RepID=A0ABR3KIU5_TRISP
MVNGANQSDSPAQLASVRCQFPKRGGKIETRLSVRYREKALRRKWISQAPGFEQWSKFVSLIPKLLRSAVAILDHLPAPVSRGCDSCGRWRSMIDRLWKICRVRVSISC